MQAQARKEKDEVKRVPLAERLRSKFHERVYGELPKEDPKSAQEPEEADNGKK